MRTHDFNKGLNGLKSYFISSVFVFVNFHFFFLNHLQLFHLWEVQMIHLDLQYKAHSPKYSKKPTCSQR